jgi:hypothetical protein
MPAENQPKAKIKPCLAADLADLPCSEYSQVGNSIAISQ